MNREQAFKQLLATVGQDLQGYGRLEQLLEQQFAAALEHQAEALRQLGSDIVAQCDALQASRDQRLQLAGQLLARAVPPRWTRCSSSCPPPRSKPAVSAGMRWWSRSACARP